MEKIYKLICFARILGQSKRRSLDHLSWQSDSNHFPVRKFECSSFAHQRLQQTVRANSSRENDGKKVDTQGPNPPKFSFPQWARWIVGSLFVLLLPFLKLEWGSKLRAIQGEAALVMGEVEAAAKVIEKVAEGTEKVAEEVAESLPEGNTNLKEAAQWVERASKATAHDAQLAQDLIHKVEAVEQDLNDLETLVEPLIEKIVNGRGPK